jgi:nitroimidazol reductase NimA-like FMN-containing flavoprotein (pyridoxamine 5'-phosphate oxidase superfamily)
MARSEEPTSEPTAPPQTPRDAPASDTFWAAAEVGTELIELDRRECLELLAAESVGRIAYSAGTGARILPVNYTLIDDCVIFRTVPNGEIYRHALNSNCAFEIDESDEFFQSGWSVVALGRLELANEDDFARMRYGKAPEAWAGGNRYMFVRLQCEHVSGRRVIGHGR